ncbi:methylated-DNA--[protein]-cysteine S-methyltransferase [Hutsoniella sourekii]|uniref:methylated-DNA--[protein]-cysteine S-methyltransferase n=1 Tax=Hutsoniella sourekii TaxID=87650 RepID=UPI0004B06EC7|nr:methylated-DNA--[protein]-cysteine S-methyltransferase [Hutsoniella sourekii]
MIYRDYLEFEYGLLEIRASENHLLYLQPTHEKSSIRPNSITQMTQEQLVDYFKLRRQSFDLPIKWQGSDFQVQVLQSLQTIPYGQTRTYKEVALSIGNPGASRAVGQANHRNPIYVVIPCHRVIATNGQLSGYGGGIEMKKYLLSLEKKGATKPKG